MDGKNIDRTGLVEWLRGFVEKHLALDAENEELASRAHDRNMYMGCCHY